MLHFMSDDLSQIRQNNNGVRSQVRFYICFEEHLFEHFDHNLDRATINMIFDQFRVYVPDLGT